MSLDHGLIDWVEEATGPLGHFTRRRMFGGAGLYMDGVIFAMIADGELWFKTDRLSDAAFEAAGCERLTFTTANGERQAMMPYRRAPSDVYDDADAMRDWAALAVEAGRRSRKK